MTEGRSGFLLRLGQSKVSNPDYYKFTRYELIQQRRLYTKKINEWFFRLIKDSTKNVCVENEANFLSD